MATVQKRSFNSAVSLSFPQNDGHGMSTIQHQKSQRLHVNRVALIQELNVAHVLPHLIKSGVITDEDRKSIVAAKTTHNKTRRLLDLLPQKGRGVNWYEVFREALIYPNTYNGDTRKKYQILVAFLDNTIIPAPQKFREASGYARTESRLPRLPAIGVSDTAAKTRSASYVTFAPSQELYTNGKMSSGKDTEPDVKSTGSSTVPVLKHFATIIREPREHFQRLEKSSNQEDATQLEKEQDVLKKMRNLEVMFVLERRGQIPDGAELCFSRAMEDMLADSSVYHLYYKYFQQVKLTHNIDMMADIGNSFIRFLERLKDSRNDELREQVVKSAFKLFKFMCDYGLYYQSEVLLFALTRYLSTHQCVETRVAMWEAYVKLMHVSNINVKYHEANQSRNMAKNISYNIKDDKHLLDKSELHREQSVMMREHDSVSQAVPLAEKAFKEVAPTDQQGIVEALCNLSLVHSMQGELKKSQQLAVEAVRHAKGYFGTHHPLYVKALLHFCHYSNEFAQDTMGVEVAREAVAMAEKVYGGATTLLLAQAHQVLATALLVVDADTASGSDEHHREAETALDMARLVLPYDHPLLALFRFTLAQSLQWRSMTQLSEDAIASLTLAETEAQAALRVFKISWGANSLKAGQAHNLMAQIYAKMTRWEEAEQTLLTSYALHRQTLPANCYHMQLMKATLGTFYRTIGRPLDAIQLLKDVTDNSDACGGMYVKWVHICCETMISQMKATNQDKEANTYQVALVNWLNKNRQLNRSVTWADLHAPPQMHKRVTGGATEGAGEGSGTKKD